MDVEFTGRQLDRLAQELPLVATFARLGPLEWWTFHLGGGFLVIRLQYGKKLLRGDLPLYFRELGRFDAQLERHALSTNQPGHESPRTEITLQELTLEEALTFLEGLNTAAPQAA